MFTRYVAFGAIFSGCLAAAPGQGLACPQTPLWLQSLILSDAMMSAEMPGANRVECAKANVMGQGPTLVCRWPFDYRSTHVFETFDALDTALMACAAHAPVDPGAQVNHPDSYTQRIFTIGDKGLSLALKDKASLNETYIFISIWRDQGQ